MRTVYTLETLVSESRMSLSPAQRGLCSKTVEVSVKNERKFLKFIENATKVIE